MLDWQRVCSEVKSERSFSLRLFSVKFQDDSRQKTPLRGNGCSLQLGPSGNPDSCCILATQHFSTKDHLTSWENTAQRRSYGRPQFETRWYHTEYQDSNWVKTLRYALNIMLGAQELNIDKKPQNQLVREATEILIGTSSPKGFSPGRVEISTNKPVEASCVPEQDMESYYHASFEIPYLLLTHMEQIIAAHDRPKLEAPMLRRHSDSMLGANFLEGPIPHDISLVQFDAERKVLPRPSDFLPRQSTTSYLDNHKVFRDVRLTIKKAVPFDGLVDSSNIVKLEDEWLYKYPDCFNRESVFKNDEREEGRKQVRYEMKSSKAISKPIAFDRYVAGNIKLQDFSHLTSVKRNTRRDSRFVLSIFEARSASKASVRSTGRPTMKAMSTS